MSCGYTSSPSKCLHDLERDCFTLLLLRDAQAGFVTTPFTFGWLSSRCQCSVEGILWNSRLVYVH
jgi:hypothetical protein